MVDYRKEYCRLVRFLEVHKFDYLDRVRADGRSLCDLKITTFLCVIEFLMNLVCFNQLNWRPASIKPDGPFRIISGEERNRIVEHIIAWQEDLHVYPKLAKTQITCDLSSWSERRALLLVAAMDEMDKLDNYSGILADRKPNPRMSLSLLESFSKSAAQSSDDSGHSSCSSSSKAYIVVRTADQSYEVLVKPQ